MRSLAAFLILGFTTTLLGQVVSGTTQAAPAPAQWRVDTYTWSGWAFIKWPSGREETVYGSGTTQATDPNQAAAFGMNQFRYGQLQRLEQQGATIQRCHVDATKIPTTS